MIKKIKIFLLSILGLIKMQKLIKKNKDYCLIIDCHISIGDQCFILSCCHEFIKNQNAKIVICEKRIEIAKKFDISENDIISLKEKTILQIRYAVHNYFFKYIINKWQKKGAIIITSPWFYVDSILRNSSLKLSIMDIIKHGAFKLNDNVKPQYPIVTYIEPKVTINKPYIIINPYSGSSNISIDIFSKLGVLLNKMGYTVYCNLAPNQEPIKNTIPLSISIDELFNIAKDATCIISIRSGILDYIISNCKKMYVLYENNGYFNFFSLKSWQTNCKLYEHIYQESITPEDIIKEIFDNDN